VADLKPAYLIFGDDDAKIDAWRARVRKRAEDERGTGGLERFDGGDTGPDEIAAALTTLSFDSGTGRPASSSRWRRSWPRSRPRPCSC
jgi:hypothetical protein